MIGTIFSGIMAYFMARLKVDQERRSEETAAKVDEVKDAVAHSSEDAAASVLEVRKTAAGTAAKVEGVQKTLVQSTQESTHRLDDLTAVALATQKLGKKTHRMVNSAMGIQLRISALALRRLAQMTGNPEDIAAAELAEQVYAEHHAAEVVVEKGIDQATQEELSKVENQAGQEVTGKVEDKGAPGV